ncbi:MAG TPA: helix-turn-helix transcriptional regulator [Stellaceae bacterium]|nr:helix-turn-helix transcriptional regulator [Stellaceae bacterium]
MGQLATAVRYTAYGDHDVSTYVPLVETLGEESFPDAFGQAVLSVLPAHMFSVFRLDAQKRIRYLFAGGNMVTDRDFARRASARYADGYWKLDPAMRSVLADGDWNMTLRSQAWDAIPPSEYRTFCYERVHVHERLLVCRRVKDEAIMIGLYRTPDAQPFTDFCLRNLEDTAEFLTTLAWKHAQVVANYDSRYLKPGDTSVARQLANANDQLSAREIEVCTGLLLGRSTKEIARTLGVMPSSIVTFRKRAFLKLNIATRQDLIRLYEQSLDA